MSAYKQIAKDHLTKEDLIELLQELERPEPLKLTRDRIKINHYKNLLKNKYVRGQA